MKSYALLKVLLKNGLEMLEDMREINGNIFCIALTASEIRKDEMEEIIDIYFRKPITYEDMFIILRGIVKKFGL